MNVSLYSALTIVSMAAVTTACADQKEKKEKLNVVFIAVDDLKPILGCYGDTLVKTPHIDRLAAMGTVFDRTYCQQAISGATRSSLLTGLRPDRTGVYDLVTKIRKINPDVVTLPEHFKNEGYVTSGVGKIFHGSNVVDEDNAHSWSIPYLDVKDCYDSKHGLPVGKGYQDPETKRLFRQYEQEAKAKGWDKEKVTAYVKSKIMPATECLDVTDNTYVDGAVTLKAEEQLKKLAKSDKPFFLAVGYIKPHLPFTAPKKYWDLYDREQIPLAAFQENASASPAIAYHSCGELRQYTDIPARSTYSQTRKGLTVDADKQKELIHGYYACISYMDAQIGKLLDTMEKLDMLDNTIIVFWGDHGWHLGDHNLWNKHSNFEQATRVPLIIAAPGLKPGHAGTLAEFVDIYPTLCDLSGIPAPTDIDGQSLVPAMEDKNSDIHVYAVSQYPRSLSKQEMKEKKAYTSRKIMGYSLRTKQYRYTVWMNDFTTAKAFDEKKVYAEELYDYKLDPQETRNFAKEESHAQVLAELKNHMIDFFHQSQKKKKNL